MPRQNLYKVKVWQRGYFDEPKEVIIGAPNMQAAKNKAEHELGRVVSVERYGGTRSPMYRTYMK